MNILFIYPLVFHPQRGGIERVSILLCREFMKRGHHVFFMHNVRDKDRMDYPYPVPLYFFPNPVQELDENGLFYRNFLCEQHIDIVINQDPLVYHDLCRFSKTLPEIHTISVMHQHPLDIYNHFFEFIMCGVKGKNTIMGKIRRVARIVKVPILKYNFVRTLRSNYKDTFAYTDLLCLLSLKFIPDLKQIYSKDMDRVIAIPNPNTYPAQEGIHIPKKKQLLYVGRIEWRQKRVVRLVDIWKHIYKDFPDWELIIVGDGSARQDLELKSSKLERIVFTGWQDPESFYRNASILCMTSDFEGWGMVLTEAMIFGTVPIAYNSFASVTDIIEDGQTGMLVPPFSRKQYIQKLEMLMRDEELRTRMSDACMQSVKRFDIQNVADKWEEVFKRLKTKTD